MLNALSIRTLSKEEETEKKKKKKKNTALSLFLSLPLDDFIYHVVLERRDGINGGGQTRSSLACTVVQRGNLLPINRVPVIETALSAVH